MTVINGVPVIGIDAGNYNTKTANTCFVSGFKEVGENDLVTDVLHYNDKHYALTNTPLMVRDDKTKNDDFKILALFAIAKEIKSNNMSLGSVSRIQLAVGLPPGKMSIADYKKSLESYYLGTYKFKFGEEPAHIEIVDVEVFPQCYSVLMTTLVPEINTDEEAIETDVINDPKMLLTTLTDEAQVVLLDFGGGTVDVIFLEYGNMSIEHYYSFDLGIRKCLSAIDREFELKTGYPLGETIITQHLLGKKTRITDEDQTIIDSHKDRYIKELMIALDNRKIPIKNSLVILMGGNAGLIYKAVKDMGVFNHLKIITDIHANAKGYEAFAKQILAGGQGD